jgi:anti-sigma regulatory factor (Ser/Thr protein kinase)
MMNKPMLDNQITSKVPGNACMPTVSLSIGREVDVYLAISRGRELATMIGFDIIDRTRVEIVILELSRNILVHAGNGTLLLERVERDGTPGLSIMVSDQGPGIADIELAMQDGYSTASTLGAGLPGVRRLMDEFEIDSAPGQGTRVRALKWLSQRRRGGS